LLYPFPYALLYPFPYAFLPLLLPTGMENRLPMSRTDNTPSIEPNHAMTSEFYYTGRIVQ